MIHEVRPPAPPRYDARPLREPPPRRGRPLIVADRVILYAGPGQPDHPASDAVIQSALRPSERHRRIYEMSTRTPALRRRVALRAREAAQALRAVADDYDHHPGTSAQRVHRRQAARALEEYAHAVELRYLEDDKREYVRRCAGH